MKMRHLKYKANRLAGMNRKNAAIAAGYSHSYATHKAWKIEEVVESSIHDALEQAGLTAKFQAEVLFDLADQDNPTVQIQALKHIAELKKQTKSDINIDNSKHYSKITYEFKTGDQPEVVHNRLKDKALI